MILEQFYLNCLAHASYLVGDRETRSAVIVDPQRDVQRYLEAAERHGLEIRHVFLTHFHADFVAGHLELRDRTGAKIHLGARAEAEYAFQPMRDGDALEIGRVRLSILETPGHTPESISILVFDLDTDGSKPKAVLTGDTLFVGDVGRPDLRASLGWSAAELGRLLYHSLRTKLLPLPDETIVYPAHGPGSLCGKAISAELASTIGNQRRLNYALQPMSEEDFLRIVTADQPDAPPYFTYDAVLNTKERPTLDRALERQLTPLDLEAALTMLNAGAQALDVRDPGEYANAHLAGSINVGLGGEYATWAGTVLDHQRPVILIAEPGREEEAALRLGRIGFDIVAGYLRDGIHALESRPELVERRERIAPAAASALLSSSRPPIIVDVRSAREWGTKHIEGSVNVPLSQLRKRVGELPRDRGVVVHCAGGYRSSIAASVLEQHGFTNLLELNGGLAAWEAAKLPVESSQAR
jgi:glyoxylase-like metal-dependent hydrolase (beta-lactamase superfamily II)/rhodanese-related sulfurtransferase